MTQTKPVIAFRLVGGVVDFLQTAKKSIEDFLLEFGLDIGFYVGLMVFLVWAASYLE